jgi:hypothetical protein
MAIFALEAEAQDRSKVKVDPGISVHNYKHPNKAARAKEQEVMKHRRFTSKVGIFKRSIRTPLMRESSLPPKYAKRSGWVIFKRSGPKPTTKLNPLTNPEHYKVAN